MFREIVKELRHHAPFTALGALLGIGLIAFLRNITPEVSYEFFYVFHPAHVLLSALVTASMYHRHVCPHNRRHCNLFVLLVIGYVGSIGVATVSDSIMPYIGEVLLDMPHRHAHIGFLERWWLITTMALIGIMIAYINPATKFPHFAHVLVSTAASLFHILMAKGATVSFFAYAAIFLFLFIAVWVPCCVSDIVFPLFFVKNPESIRHEH
ncbi:MAG: hypothetical protein JXD21_01370 [Candidatus Omnitrophica bacterium]|nr:hypothetical protein [Candidatus Omnitrophota bacterium]